MATPVSIVVVSRDRPEALFRCVLGLSQLQYNHFEVVVVSDENGLAALEQFAGKIKTVLFEKPNISIARNLGIQNSAGEIVAFIDDDAVPEPSWLTYLTEPFEQPEVDVVGGFVIGRNGISFQWKARVLDEQGFASDHFVDETKPTVLRLKSGQVAKTEGTNMAVRRAALIDVGGFDCAYHFYLDETDLNVRLAKAGHITAIAPMAQVHHGFASSRRRRTDRVPKDLFDIGASWAVFQRKFVAKNTWSTHWKHVVTDERKRLVRHMISGGLEPRSVRELMKSLFDGYRSGLTRKSSFLEFPDDSAEPFLCFPSLKRDSVFRASRSISRKATQKYVNEVVQHGAIATVLSLSPTALFHRVSFNEQGYWEQTGGLFGKSLRNQKLLKYWSFKRRVHFEAQRIKAVRLLSGENGKSDDVNV